MRGFLILVIIYIYALSLLGKKIFLYHLWKETKHTQVFLSLRWKHIKNSERYGMFIVISEPTLLLINHPHKWQKELKDDKKIPTRVSNIPTWITQPLLPYKRILASLQYCGMGACKNYQLVINFYSSSNVMAQHMRVCTAPVNMWFI